MAGQGYRHAASTRRGPAAGRTRLGQAAGVAAAACGHGGLARPSPSSSQRIAYAHRTLSSRAASRSKEAASDDRLRIGPRSVRIASTCRTNAGSLQAAGAAVRLVPATDRTRRSASSANARLGVDAEAGERSPFEGRRSSNGRRVPPVAAASPTRDPRVGWGSGGRATIDMPAVSVGDINGGLSWSEPLRTRGGPLAIKRASRGPGHGPLVASWPTSRVMAHGSRRGPRAGS